MLGDDDTMETEYAHAFSEDNLEDWIDSPLDSSQPTSSPVVDAESHPKKKRRVKGPGGIDFDEPSAFELELQKHEVASGT
jgi:hypothetical protein